MKNVPVTSSLDQEPSALIASGTPVKADLSGLGVRFKIARSTAEMEQAFSLVHDSYVENGLSLAQPSGLRLTLQHAVPSSAVIVAVYRGRVLFTISVFADSWLGLPMDQVYRGELDTLRKSKRILAEFGSLALHKNITSWAPELVPSLPAILSHGVITATHYTQDVLLATDLVVACHPGHAFYYSRQYLFEKFGPERNYDYVCGNPAVALRLNLDGFSARLRHAGNASRRIKLTSECFHSTPAFVERTKLPPLWTQDMLSHFFTRRTSLFQEAPVNTVTRLLREHRQQRQQLEGRADTTPSDDTHFAPAMLTLATG